MFESPLSFTYEKLSALKFKELQKLSVQFHVNKRWAKKQELIENLLALKNKNICNKDEALGIQQQEEKEWTDGSLVFKDLAINEIKDNDSSNRLTFNIEKSNSNSSDTRLTFEVSQNGKNLLIGDQETKHSRETYDIPPRKEDFDVEPFIDSRATFEIPQNGNKILEETRNECLQTLSQKDNSLFNETNSRATFEIPLKGKNLLNETEGETKYPIKESLHSEKVDSRATFDIPQNGKIFIKDIKNESKNSNFCKKGTEKNFKEQQKNTNTKLGQNDLLKNSNLQQIGDKKLIFDISLKSDKEKSSETSKVKMLTIPYERVSKRNKKDSQPLKSEKTPMKLSKMSINIKKTSRPPASKIELFKSPIPSSIRKPVKDQILIPSLTKIQTKQIIQSKPPMKLQFDEEKKTNIIKIQNKEEGNKENIKRNLRRRSKTEDNALAKKTNSVKVNFMSPPVVKTNHRVSLQLRKTPYKEASEKITPARLNKTVSRIPKPSATTAKASGVTKMPNFAKIHQKQFEQMDSLHDYIKKKEERARKLFGTPQPGPQARVLNKSATVFQFQSTISENSTTKFGKLFENSRNIMTPSKRKETIVQKDAIKNKLPPAKVATEVKDRNRNHIHGVRTNKRFELQMKLRKLM